MIPSYLGKSTYIGDSSLTLCLDRNLGEKSNKEKERKEKKGEEQGERIHLVCLGEKGRERNRDESFPSKSF